MVWWWWNPESMKVKMRWCWEAEANRGIVSLKSLVTANLGFAVPVTALKQILEKPNPVLMENWLTLGVLDKNEWKTIYGGRWRQRAGRIIADGGGGSSGEPALPSGR